MTMTARGLAKLIEETGELQQIAGKKLAYFHTDEHPDGKGSLKARMEDEIADVRAISAFVTDEFTLDEIRINERTAAKLKQYREWHSIDEDGKNND